MHKRSAVSAFWLALFALPVSVCLPAAAIELALPADCVPGVNCFVQQYPDMDSGPGAVDPFCGGATYDGHNGTDLRVLSMKDVTRGVPVLAMADGKVLRSRDGEPDRLVVTADEGKAVGSRQCGNGVVVHHGDGVEAQYCHMKQFSIAVRPGFSVRKGEKIGEIGASGMAQFPHVHVSVRKNGREVDPSTGRTVSGGCGNGTVRIDPLFSRGVLELLGRGETQLLSFGLAGAPVAHAELALSGPPPVADRSSDALVGWAWLQNVRKGDRVSVEVSRPDGTPMASGTTEPIDRAKATYSSYTGKRGAPLPGIYSVTVRLLRDGEGIFEKTGTYRVK